MVVTRSLSPDKWWATGHKLYFVVCSMWQWSSIIYLWSRPICCRIDRIGFVLNATTNHSQRAWMSSYICICVWVSVLSKRTTVQHAAILNTSKLENIAASYCSIVRYSSRRRKRKNISSFYADIVFSTLTSIIICTTIDADWSILLNVSTHVVCPMQEFSTPIHISIFCCFRIYIAVCNGLFIVCLNWMVGLLTALWHFCHIHTFHTSIVAAENQWRTPTGSAFFLTMFLAKALPTDETTSFRCYNIYFIETFNLNGRWCWRLLEWPNAPHTIPYHFYWLMFVSFEYYAKK